MAEQVTFAANCRRAARVKGGVLAAAPLDVRDPETGQQPVQHALEIEEVQLSVVGVALPVRGTAPAGHEQGQTPRLAGQFLARLWQVDLADLEDLLGLAPARVGGGAVQHLREQGMAQHALFRRDGVEQFDVRLRVKTGAAARRQQGLAFR